MIDEMVYGRRRKETLSEPYLQIARYLSGVIFLVLGLNGFLNFKGQPISFNAALDTSEREMIERALKESAGRVGGLKGARCQTRAPSPSVRIQNQAFGINKFRFRRP
jgi:hypothetical protein